MDISSKLPEIPATQAKQSFGEMLDRLRADAAVAITSHKRVKAVVTTPEVWSRALIAIEAADSNSDRVQARVDQERVEFERLQRHALLSIDLISSSPERRDELLTAARARVLRWRAKNLCSNDIIELWEGLLSLPIQDLAREMVGDMGGWGRVLRQNTPFSLGPFEVQRPPQDRA